MGLAINRSEFLQGDIQGRNRPIRPPWSIPEMEFRDHCTSCGDCLTACPTNIIEYGRGRLPVINFDIGECLFCGDCVEKCMSGSLSKTLFQQNAEAWIHKVQVAEKCLNHQGVLCRSCGDRCPERAIVFRPQIGGRITLEIKLEYCNGCGACVAPCPVQAVTMTAATRTTIPEQKSRLENCA